MKHTDDGKDTRWLTIEWYEQFLEVDYNLASMYLINELLTNGDFWKLDYMFVNFIRQSHNVDPIILNFLYKLSPTNTKDSYLNSFLDVINELEKTDEKLAKLSLINLLTRELNNSSETLRKKTVRKIQNLKDRLKVTILVNNDNDKHKTTPTTDSYNKKDLREILTKKLCRNISLEGKTEAELIKYYDEKDRLQEEDLNYLYFFLQENNSANLAKELLIPIIRKRFPSEGSERFKQMCSLIGSLSLASEIKVFLFINNFVYSKDGWFSNFVDKQSLKKAVEIDKGESSRVLAIMLHEIFSNSGYLSKSTANLIIAFEYAGLENEQILSMYKRGFKFIQNRLPDNSNFVWKDIEDTEITGMNNNEIAIVMLLSKTTNLDAFVQKEVIVAISYLMKYDDNLLIKPFRWFFNNIEHFHQLSVASMLELFLVEIDNHASFFNSIKGDLKKVFVIENLYIHNNLQDILDSLEHE